MIQQLFHPAVASWFQKTFPFPSEPQIPAWSAFKSKRHALIAAPTGSGKTLAAFLGALDDLVRENEAGTLRDETYVVYVSPLKALSNDIEKNLQIPLEGIGLELNQRGTLDHGIRVMVRTGDTPSHVRSAMVKRPPHILVTTPESLYIMLTSDGGRRVLKTARTLIVDEIHALVGTKRGTHFSLSVERLEELTQHPLIRIGLSATQKPIKEVARFLVGTPNIDANNQPQCDIIDAGHKRRMDLAIELPLSPLEAVMSNEVWEEVYNRLCRLIEDHHTTLVFVNTRRMAERVAKLLSERLGKEAVTSHHGSLSKEHRLEAEQRLKCGSLKALVATASLELGIDIGDVDLVCQMGTTHSIGTFLQRVGRSGHFAGGIPKGRLFPLTRDELLEAAALFDAIRRDELDAVEIPLGALDILAQQVVAETSIRPWKERHLAETVRRAYPYKSLSDKDFQDTLKMLSEGFSTRWGRRGAYIFRDVIHGKVRGRRGAKITAVTSGGAIPDNADYRVIMEPTGMFVGSVNEDFAIESMAGDIFQLGNTSWRILKIESGKIRVEDAHGLPPNLPFWFGEAPSRTTEFSAAVSRLRQEVTHRIQDGSALEWLTHTVGLSQEAAQQLVDYLAAAHAALGAMPTQKRLVLERFFDESGGMQMVLHAPFGSRINRAWGLALRKRFCKQFNYELQAAATEDAVILSLGVTHSFKLSEVFSYLNSKTVEDVLTQAMLTAPMFEIRWRWNAGRSLAIPRMRNGKKTPSPLQRMQAQDLLSVVFPDQVACAENLPGDREVPDHPLAKQTVYDCLHEAMDIDGLKEILESIEAGELETIAKDMTEPSPLSQEILNAKPYAFLDDAPLEERRTQAVVNRRWLDPETASDLGALDEAAITRVRSEAWPDARDKEEMADSLSLMGFIREDELSDPEWSGFLKELAGEGRAGVLEGSAGSLWIAAERRPQFRALFPELAVIPEPRLPAHLQTPPERTQALVELFRGRLETLGPVAESVLAASLGVTPADVTLAMAHLQGEGFAFQGVFTQGATETEWCDRRLLARIHRYTLKRLRKEIEPVSARDYMRFLFEWHGISGDSKPTGRESLLRVLNQLEGFSARASAWESDILPLRLSGYDPVWLDSLCSAGKLTWCRIKSPANPQGRFSGSVRSTPIALVGRTAVAHWMRGNQPEAHLLSTTASILYQRLQEGGALFFDELVDSTELLPTQTEEALRELVAWGWVTADSFAGLRSLLVPPNKRKGRQRRRPGYDIREAGRWALVQRKTLQNQQDSIEVVAQTYLQRYGIVFRAVLQRESTPPWRDMLRVFRRMEARGELRGGRFVAGFSGEQYALPQVVSMLRKVRHKPLTETLFTLSAADPLNLQGILLPGDRIPAVAQNRVTFQDGQPFWGEAGEGRIRPSGN